MTSSVVEFMGRMRRKRATAIRIPTLDANTWTEPMMRNGRPLFQPSPTIIELTDAGVTLLEYRNKTGIAPHGAQIRPHFQARQVQVLLREPTKRVRRFPR